MKMELIKEFYYLFITFQNAAVPHNLLSYGVSFSHNLASSSKYQRHF